MSGWALLPWYQFAAKVTRMSIKIKKAIIDVDYGDSYGSMEFEADTVVDHPMLGSMGNFLIPHDSNLVDFKEVKISLFNKDLQTTLVRDVGRYGVYFLYLRPGYVIDRVLIEPDGVVLDIFFKCDREDPKRDRLIYCFYNHTNHQTLKITGKMGPDKKKVLEKLKQDPANLIWRQYFIHDLQVRSIEVDTRSLGSGTSKDILTADEVAEYLGLEVKTIRNWTSQNKIKYFKIGSSVRYKKTEIDKAIEENELGKAKPKRKNKG
jgi:excisionase family DNA binding protein